MRSHVLFIHFKVKIMKIRNKVNISIILSIFLISSLIPVLSSQNKNGWKVGEVYSWETYLSVTSTTNLDSKIQNSSECNIYTESYKVIADNTTSKKLTYSNNNGGVPNQADYFYSSTSVGSKLGQMFIPIPVINKVNKTVLYSFYATRPYILSEFDPIIYKNYLDQTWLNNNSVMVLFWNGTAQIPYTVGEFLSSINSMKINGQTPRNGINAITSTTRNYKFEFDLTKGFRMASLNYADFNITVEKKIYNIEFGIRTDGFLDHFKVDNYLVKNASDGYGVDYEYHYYQKFNHLDILASCNGVIDYSIPSSNSTVVFLIGLLVGIVCVVIIQKADKKYKQNQFNAKYKKIQDDE